MTFYFRNNRGLWVTSFYALFLSLKRGIITTRTSKHNAYLKRTFYVIIMEAMLAYDDVMYNRRNLWYFGECKVFYIKWCVLTKKYCQSVGQIPLAMDKKTLALFSSQLFLLTFFFVESIIQMLIKPISVRHCPKYWNDHNGESQIVISRSHFANWSMNYKGVKIIKL